jgi:hypothetical protein
MGSLVNQYLKSLKDQTYVVMLCYTCRDDAVWYCNPCPVTHIKILKKKLKRKQNVESSPNKDIHRAYIGSPKNV